MAAASARQAARRMEDRISHAEVSGISDEKLSRRVEKLVGAHERVNDREQELTAGGWGAHRAGAQEGAVIGPAKPSQADEITAERVNSMSWDQLAEFGGELGDDPEAWDKLETLVNERETREAEESAQRQQESFDAWVAGTFSRDDDQVKNPAARPRRALTARERTREEYECHVAAQYFQAENELGVLLNREGQAKGIDAYSLFSGPISRARKYGSEELQSWFARNGRLTLASYRHQVLGWHSDSAAAQRGKVEGFDHVARV